MTFTLTLEEEKEVRAEADWQGILAQQTDLAWSGLVYWKKVITFGGEPMPRILEGAWQEIKAHKAELVGRNVPLIVTSEVGENDEIPRYSVQSKPTLKSYSCKDCGADRQLL